MKDAKDVNVSINDRFFTIDIAVEDVELIESIFEALTRYVKEGSAIKVRQTSEKSLSDSVSIISKLITKSNQVDEWKTETKQLISTLRRVE